MKATFVGLVLIVLGGLAALFGIVIALGSSIDMDPPHDQVGTRLVVALGGAVTAYVGHAVLRHAGTEPGEDLNAWP